MADISELFAIATRYHQGGQLAEALPLYQQILAMQPAHVGALSMMGVLACQSGRLEEGITFYQRSLAVKPDLVEAHYNLAQALQLVGRRDEAIKHFRTVASLQSNNPEVHNNLGILLTQRGEFEQAVRHYQQALAINPNHVNTYINLGGLLANVGQVEGAIAHFKQALQLQSDSVQARFALGNVLNSQGRIDEAVVHFQQALTLHPAPEVYYSLGKTLEEQGQTEFAIAQFKAALKLKPDFAEATWQRHLILPVLYDSPKQILDYRKQFCRELNRLIQSIDLTTAEGKKFALQGIGSRTNFYLAYQGLNDRGLQCKYGQFVHKVMSANFPQWAGAERYHSMRAGLPGRSQEQQVLVKPAPTLPDTRHPTPDTPSPPTTFPPKIRIGYLSAHMMAHSAAAWVRGWLRERDRSSFEVFCYHTGQGVDFVTAEIRELSDQFRHIPGPIERICSQVVSDELDVLVFTDIGMDAQTTQLAGLRLAPVQCTAWGHPVTSGLPTIDYYLSSDLMEPANAQQHYSETLVRLPNIGICYAKPPQPTVQKSRQDLGLRDNAIIYLCFQSPYKYLPQFDRVFAQIAQQVASAQFVFLRHASEHIVRRFQVRLQKAFAEVGLKSTDYCVFLSKLDRESYWSLTQVADIFLDSLEWSGGNSTLEAVAFGLPVVTCPGQFMRGRHSYAIIQMLGVTETIASDVTNYIEIAVKLGLKPEWRNQVSEAIVRNHSRLYDDTTCVRALEEFFRKVVGDRD